MVRPMNDRMKQSIYDNLNLQANFVKEVVSTICKILLKIKTKKEKKIQEEKNDQKA